jgi:hypothetical protein
MRTSFHCSLLAKCHYAHRLRVSEGLAVTFIVMLSKSVDYVHLEQADWFGEAKLGAGAKLQAGAKFEHCAAVPCLFGCNFNVRYRTDRLNPGADPDDG